MNDFDTSGVASTGQHGLPGQARVISLDHAASLTLAADKRDRKLQLEQGQLWLTCTRRALAPVCPRVGAGQVDPASADVAGRDQSDLWLAAGEAVQLPAGSHWVLQAWPEARLNMRTASTTQGQWSGRGARHGGWLQGMVAAARRLLHLHARPPVNHARVGLTGAGCN